MLQGFSEEGFPFAGEAFADRGYEPDGTLTPRGRPGALKATADDAADQAVSLALSGEVVASDGAVLRVDARTLCLHADTPGAVDFAREIAARLRKAGVEIRPL